MGTMNSPSVGTVAWRLCTVHFIGHALALGAAATAPLLTTPTETNQLTARHQNIVYSEGYLILTSLVLALYKISRQRVCPEAALESFLWQSQAIVLLLTWPFSSAVFAWWALVFTLLHLLVPLTEPSVPGDCNCAPIAELTQRNFDAICNPTGGSGESTAAQVVVLYSHLSSACHQQFPNLADLALKYSGPNLKWGRVDVARFPEVGERYGISGAAIASPTIFTLPILLLFSGGVLRARVDSASESVSWVPFPRGSSGFTQASIVNKFQLDSWLVRNHNKAA